MPCLKLFKIPQCYSATFKPTCLSNVPNVFHLLLEQPDVVVPGLAGPEVVRVVHVGVVASQVGGGGLVHDGPVDAQVGVGAEAHVLRDVPRHALHAVEIAVRQAAHVAWEVHVVQGRGLAGGRQA